MDKTISEKRVFKYSIGEKLAAIPESKRARIRERIAERCNVSLTTLSRWINATWEESQDIPGTALKEISDILLVPVEDLYNQKP